MARYPRYAPEFSLRIQGEPLPGALRGSISSITYQDGLEGADRVEVTIANPGLRWLDHPLPLKIELSNLAGTILLSLDNTTQTVTIQAANSIELKAVAQIKLQAANIDIQGGVATNVKSTGVCNITAPLVKIN